MIENHVVVYIGLNKIERDPNVLIKNKGFRVFFYKKEPLKRIVIATGKVDFNDDGILILQVKQPNYDTENYLVSSVLVFYNSDM